MKSLISPDIDAQILEAVVAPDKPTLSAGMARMLLKLSFQAEQKAEIEALLERNNAGTITESERRQLEAYVRVGNFLSLLQAKARATVSRVGKK